MVVLGLVAFVAMRFLGGGAKIAAVDPSRAKVGQIAAITGGPFSADPAAKREAWADLMKRASLTQHHRISREQLSVREHMSMLLRGLSGRRFAIFEELFDTGRGPQVVVVTFIALLELAREHLIEVTQAEAFAPIYVRLAYQAS